MARGVAAARRANRVAREVEVVRPEGPIMICDMRTTY
jgi:hypothetical protein